MIPAHAATDAPRTTLPQTPSGRRPWARCPPAMAAKTGPVAEEGAIDAECAIVVIDQSPETSLLDPESNQRIAQPLNASERRQQNAVGSLSLLDRARL